MGNIVYVNGNIVAYNGYHLAKGFGALYAKPSDGVVEVIDGDLNLEVDNHTILS